MDADFGLIDLVPQREQRIVMLCALIAKSKERDFDTTRPSAFCAWCFRPATF